MKSRDRIMKVELIPLTSDDREQFILDNQEAFNFGAMEEEENVVEKDDQFSDGMFRFEKEIK